jgi:hypothetical protein
VQWQAAEPFLGRGIQQPNKQIKTEQQEVWLASQSLYLIVPREESAKKERCAD